MKKCSKSADNLSLEFKMKPRLYDLFFIHQDQGHTYLKNAIMNPIKVNNHLTHINWIKYEPVCFVKSLTLYKQKRKTNMIW